MTFKYENVYVNEYSTVAGPYEKKGPLGDKFDKTYDDFYMGEKSWEQAEIKMVEDAIKIVLQKSHKHLHDIELSIGGDLLDQICATTYANRKFNIPHLGIYSACSTNTEGILIASNFIDSSKVKNAIVTVSSHNLASEKQFRNPVEYGAPRPSSATFTSTGATCILLSNNKSKIRIESATVGKVFDSNMNDPNNMGAVMAMAAGETIHDHLVDLKRNVNDYDLIITGDLGIYGKEILKDYMKEKYNIELLSNYTDSGVLLYDLKNQKEVLAGASGPACSPLVNYSYFLPLLKKKIMKRILIVATGALFSPSMVYQKKNILSISHAVCMEGVE